MVFPVIIILRSRDFLTEKMQENINIFWEFEACLVGHESVVNVILFSKENLFSMIFFFNSVYFYLELPGAVLFFNNAEFAI